MFDDRSAVMNSDDDPAEQGRYGGMDVLPSERGGLPPRNREVVVGADDDDDDDNIGNRSRR